MDNIVEVEVIQSWWDYLLDVGTIILALINVWLVYIIYKWQHKDSTVVEERQRRVNQFNNIFLVPRMDFLKKTFDDLNTISSTFEGCVDDEDKKSETHDKIDKMIVDFDSSFVSFIAGIDSQLYDQVNRIVEGMRDKLTHDIFDTDTAKIKGAEYVQMIQTTINDHYKALLKTLFSYDGNMKEDTKKAPKGVIKYLHEILLGVIIILLGILVYHNYKTVFPNQVIFQLDSTQMNSILDAVQNDTNQRVITQGSRAIVTE